MNELNQKERLHCKGEGCIKLFVERRRDTNHYISVHMTKPVARWAQGRYRARTWTCKREGCSGGGKKTYEEYGTHLREAHNTGPYDACEKCGWTGVPANVKVQKFRNRCGT